MPVAEAEQGATDHALSARSTALPNHACSGHAETVTALRFDRRCHSTSRVIAIVVGGSRGSGRSPSESDRLNKHARTARASAVAAGAVDVAPELLVGVSYALRVGVVWQRPACWRRGCVLRTPVTVSLRTRRFSYRSAQVVLGHGVGSADTCASWTGAPL